jgi:HAD superfamily hydrolase (TIGR01549 family)
MRTHGTRPLKAAVFDLDGTLVDSMPLVVEAFLHALEPFGLGLTAEELFLRLGAPPERTFAMLLGGPERVPVAMQRLEHYAGEQWRKIRPFPGTHDLLSHLGGRALPRGVWTGRDRRTTELILREHAMETAVEVLICGDDLPSHKPDPAGLQRILETLGVEREEAVFLGDADVDVQAGAELGVRTVLIRHGRRVRPEVAARAWRVVERPEEAFDAVRSLLGP